MIHGANPTNGLRSNHSSTAQLDPHSGLRRRLSALQRQHARGAPVGLLLVRVENSRRFCRAILDAPNLSYLGCPPRGVHRERGRRLPPAVGRLRCSHQCVAQVAQFSAFGTFFDGGCDILGGASDLVDAVGELRCLFGRQDDGVRRQRGPPDYRALLIGALPAGLPAVLPTPAEPGFGDFTTTPATGRRLETTCHEPDCKPPRLQIPVS
jgi:hypothetical protein